MSDHAPTRRLSWLLLAGIVAFPVVFAWFVLRRGYSNQLRAGAFAYLGLNLLVGLVAAFGPPPW